MTLFFAMHVPDGFLNLPVTLLTWVFAIALITISLNRVQAEYQERTVPLMGVCAAFIFAAQMINFPIPGGTSGHLLGGTLAAVLLGPWAGSL
ncbi:energy-coupling factor ABC transporter permease, partial [Pseudanabaenaceae cyanobacterium LEGE 13415]|nr:energy-coupling factor ABC transporter permease [Pseudanabaenaceae cyanobacterium LEGE 13415]